MKSGNDRRTVRRTWIFTASFLLAGAAYMLSRSGIAVLEALMTGCNYLIYVGLLLFWFQSVRARLLPSRVDIAESCISQKLLAICPGSCYTFRCGQEIWPGAHGALAQLVVRYIRIVEVRGSTPLCSTPEFRRF